jgi:hypothetical protein
MACEKQRCRARAGRQHNVEQCCPWQDASAPFGNLLCELCDTILSVGPRSTLRHEQRLETCRTCGGGESFNGSIIGLAASVLDKLEAARGESGGQIAIWRGS